MTFHDLELKWLWSRGGRTVADVFIDDIGKYVLMGDGEGGYEQVYIPHIKMLKIYYKFR